MRKKVGSALVVGAGISGIRSALDLAEVGYQVKLIDRSPHIGGILSQLDWQFPTDRCGMCRMLPLVDRDAGSQHCLRKGLFHENIELLLSTDLTAVDGEAGNFTVTLRQKEQWIDPSRCIGCGKCVEVCPVEVADAFNAGLSMRKAVYLPVPHAIPNPYVVDPAACTQCGECVKVCPTDAIRLSGRDRSDFKILVVDDERIIRDSLQAWLADEEGFSVDTAESGEAAIEKLEADTYRLMLLDIKMPGMDGVEVLKRARELQPELMVVMMTAYATVETAVEAMKVGALDYLIKPFDPETLIPRVLTIYGDMQASKGPQVEVGAILLCGGTDYYDPATGKNTFGYGAYPNVVTSLEFERIMSGTGPSAGRLTRPGDGKPIGKVAWIQCVGSRDLQIDADFCSNICCMYAIKEALVAKEKSGGSVETALFYMDMRTFGKPFQRYRDRAEKQFGVRFVRGRVHSILPDPDSGDLMLSYADRSGAMQKESFDMAVLAVGQRPSRGTEQLAALFDIPLNPWGFCRPEPLSLTRTSKEGVFLGGAFAGLRDISESVTLASAAALSASRVIHNAGGSLAVEPEDVTEFADVSRELPRTLIALCTCGDNLSHFMDKNTLAVRLKKDPAVADVVFLDQTCTAEGWEQLVEQVRSHRVNRLLIGACLPYLYARKLKELGSRVGLDPALMEVVDIRSPAFSVPDPAAEARRIGGIMEGALTMSLARLRRVDPTPPPSLAVCQRALVVGGGIAGMTAALSIADHGFEVDLVERSDALGGNLSWIRRTLEGESTEPLLEEARSRVDKHPKINVHLDSRVAGGFGQVGRFYTTLETGDGTVENLEHGAVLLATGGGEASTTEYGYGRSEAVVTQKELEIKFDEGGLDPAGLESVVFIQCVGSREEPRNFCSRVCCNTTLKQALRLKEKNPDLQVYVLYRDMMAYGFAESDYTRARRAGIVFVQYEPDEKPAVTVSENEPSVRVEAFDPILGRRIRIDAELLVLATGVAPQLPADLAETFGAQIDADGFFQEAEWKWRPVDALKEGVFACGLVHSPRSIPESIATAEAAAQRSLRILNRASIPAGRIVAEVRHSLCSLCLRCIEACPYEARSLDPEEEQIRINPLMCQGCGSCATVCPNDASVLDGFEAPQMFETIDAAIESIVDESTG